MKQKSLRLLLSIAAVSLLITACQNASTPQSEQSGSGTTSDSQSAANKYSIQFVNDDGTVLQSSEVEEGVLPVYEGTTPTKAATAEFTYTFDRWVPDIVVATQDATYTASYTSTTNEYTVTFDSLGGTQIASQTVRYGQTATKPEQDPVKPSADGHYYDFKFWTLNGQEYNFDTAVVSNITLVAEIGRAHV